ncbi:MAG: trigger factor [Myxococcota bacterium]|nr:trigger factor [Myxococcota bacterium]
MGEASAAESQLRVDTVEDSSVIRTVSVEVPEARVSQLFERTYEKLARSAQVKGFRRGKAPRKVLERVYGAAAAEEVERALISETLSDALELAAVQPVTEPDIDVQPAVADGPFRYSARVEVKPAIELPDLEGLPGKQPKVEIEESAVDEQLEQLRRDSAPLVEVPEGEVAGDGDTVEVDFEGRIDGTPFDGGSAASLPIELGSDRMIPGFEEQLIGVVGGEERELTVTFPDDYGAEALRGKDATFAVTVGAVKRLELASLDDEFAKDVGEDSLEALRSKLRGQLEERAEQQAKSMLQRSLMEALIERSDFEVPPGLVERQLHAQIKSMRQQFEGRVANDVLQSELARIHETGREGAERRVRESLLLDAIVHEHGLSVDEKAVDARLDELAVAQGTDSATMRKFAEEQGWRQSIEAELLDAAALDFLGSRASVEETTDT